MRFPQTLFAVIAFIIIIGYFAGHLPGKTLNTYYTPLTLSDVGLPDPNVPEEESAIWDSAIGRAATLFVNFALIVFNSVFTLIFSIAGAFGVAALLPQGFSIIYTLLAVAIIIAIVKLFWSGEK